jgi:hypothetical protein
MPAVHPERLTEEVNQIQGLIDNPKKLRWRLMGIFEFYADRTRRSKVSLRSGHADKKYGIPRPVLQAFERGLKESVSEHPELGLAISEELWQIDFRETRYLAITLLEHHPLEDIITHVENWSFEMKDQMLMKKLAQILISSLRIENFQGLSTISTKWLKGQQISLKMITLMALRCAVDDSDFLDLPLIFHILQDHDVIGNGELKRVLHDLLRSLIQRSEPEAAHFLLDILERDASTGRKWIRALLECFSSDQQLRFKRALST